MMTTNSSQASNGPAPSPDDLCGVCGTKRELHGDRNHEFNMNGDLIPFTPTPPPKNQPPRTREEAAAATLGKDPVARMQLRMVERMVQKGLFDGDDLMYMFGGSDANTGG